MIRTRRRARSRPATGMRLPRLPLVRGVREVLREHLREEGKSIEKHLARAWKIQAHSAQRLLNDHNRSITPEHIEAAIKCLQLDEFDAFELRVLGAIEAGWRLPLPKEI